MKLSPVKIIRARKNREQLESCLALARALPGYFTAVDLAAMARDLACRRLYLALLDNRITGFASVYTVTKEKAELTWMAADPQVQGAGVETELLERVCADLLAVGIKLLHVKCPLPGSLHLIEKRGLKIL